mmetsp:Transcript_18609/g.60890  ORF Transcript_18609/g.60890 Transcript_18609/m.60890 type:complete len:207 (-) Transcript_18609:213-833(-)
MLGVSRRRKDGKRSQRSHTRAGGGVHKEGSHRYAADRGKRRGELGSSWSGGSRVTRAVAGLAGGGVVALGQPQAHHGGGGHILVVLRAAAHGRHGKNRGGSTGDGQVAVGLHRQRRTVRAGGGHADHLGHAGRGQDGLGLLPDVVHVGLQLRHVARHLQVQHVGHVLLHYGRGNRLLRGGLLSLGQQVLQLMRLQVLHHARHLRQH